MLRINRQSTMQQGVEVQAQWVEEAGGDEDYFPLTNEELAVLASLEAEKRAVEKDAHDYNREAQSAVNEAAISTGIVVAAFVVAGIRFQSSHEPSVGLSFVLKVLSILLSLITAVMAGWKLRTVRCNFGFLNQRHNNIGLRASHLLRTLEADVARGVVDRYLRIRINFLREEADFSRPGKQILLHFQIAMILIAGVAVSLVIGRTSLSDMILF